MLTTLEALLSKHNNETLEIENEAILSENNDVDPLSNVKSHQNSIFRDWGWFRSVGIDQ